MKPDEHDTGDGGRRGQPNPFRVVGAGLELGGGIIGCVLLGYWIDHAFGTGNRGVLIGAIVGCVGGMYRLIMQALRWQRESQAANRRGSKWPRLPRMAIDASAVKREHKRVR